MDKLRRIASRRRPIIVLRAAFILALLVGVLAVLSRVIAGADQPQLPNTTSVATIGVPTGLFDPASHGVPDTIAGYKVLAVITPENTACVGPNETRLVLQTNEPTEMDFLTRNDPSRVEDEITRLGLTEFARGGITWVGSEVSIEQFLTELKTWNQTVADLGYCVQYSPVIPVTD